MKYFITDLHGEYTGLELLLTYAKLDLTVDQLVFGGDYINRGPHSGKVLKKVRQLAEQHPNHVFALIGNHEEMMRDYFEKGDKLWLSHGGRETLKNFDKTFTKSELEDYINWVSRLPLIHEDDEFVYTHAGLHPIESLHQQSREILWMPESEFYAISKDRLLALTNNKPVIHGHTPLERIYFDGARLGCDLGASTYSIVEERGLALVNLSTMTYFVYKQASGKIEKREILRY